MEQPDTIEIVGYAADRRPMHADDGVRGRKRRPMRTLKVAAAFPWRGGGATRLLQAARLHGDCDRR